MTLYGQHQYFLKKKQIIYGCETNSLYYILDLFDKIGFFNIDRIAIDSFDIYIMADTPFACNLPIEYWENKGFIYKFAKYESRYTAFT